MNVIKNGFIAGFHLIFFSLTSCTGTNYPVIEKDLVIESKILKQEVEYSLMLPSGYYEKNKNYPVVYLLHGFGGDNNSWLARCNIDHMVDSLRNCNSIGEFIYVMPEAMKTYYINNFDSSIMYGDFMVKELVQFIDKTYRTKPGAEYRALLGMSMGGFGAIIQGLQNYNSFKTIVVMGGAMRTDQMFISLSQDRYEKFFSPVFGPELSDQSRITEHWKQNSPYNLIDSTSRDKLKESNLYIDCGLYDSLWPSNKALHELLLEYKIPHEFHCRPGGHNWSYWYKSTARGLIYISEKIPD
ncbi:MAG: hypothetical protein JW894_11095 [Bacteroidales bacterium]|nr:hypothetical protein [Bacteroidales bacterium]